MIKRLKALFARLFRRTAEATVDRPPITVPKRLPVRVVPAYPMARRAPVLPDPPAPQHITATEVRRFNAPAPAETDLLTPFLLAAWLNSSSNSDDHVCAAPAPAFSSGNGGDFGGGGASGSWEPPAPSPSYESSYSSSSSSDSSSYSSSSSDSSSSSSSWD